MLRDATRHPIASPSLLDIAAGAGFAAVVRVAFLDTLALGDETATGSGSGRHGPG